MSNKQTTIDWSNIGCFSCEYIWFAVEVVVCCLLAYGLYTGVRVLNRHQKSFSYFSMCDLLQGRLDGVFYVLVSLSSAGCLIDLLVRLACLFGVMPGTIFQLWQYPYLTIVHTGLAVYSITFHYIADKLFTKRDFCNWCRRTL